jgi:meiotically up-regulated gene 157 (Mug157) protein
LALCPPAGAQTLTIPLETQIRPIVAKTLFANFFSESDGTTYVQTGDIPAMWVRDSAAQTMPYIRFVRNYPDLSKTFYGVVERDAKNIMADPYAELQRRLQRVGGEVGDRLALAPVALIFVYYANTHDRGSFTPTVHAALQKIVQVL